MAIVGRFGFAGLIGLICFLALLTPQRALAVTASDDFNRADGSLGPNWTDMTYGGLTIASQQAVGTGAAGNSGDIRTAETYGSDQYSQIQLTSTQPSGGQWIGPAVRVQGGGQSLYVGIYYWNSGSPELMLFKLESGAWTPLGAFASGALPAGTQLQLAVTGSTLTFSENGAPVITATDTDLTGGAPGIMSYGTGGADNWVGGDNSQPGGPSYSVGGTVAGLSGTVVLQNNGSDTLTLNANGAFTFATQLATGAAYDVTVKTNPTGQSCTVANGVGTIAAADVTNVSVSCVANANSSATDDFARANGSLGPNWTDMSDGGLTISSQQVVGTRAGGNSGDIRTAEAYDSDQYSQIQIPSTPLSPGQWIGPAVRAQNGGQSLYVVIYDLPATSGAIPELILFKRTGGTTWAQLGNVYNCGVLAPGTQLKLMVVGNTLAVMVNGVERIAAGDTTNPLAGGAPGIIAFGAAAAGAWSGGDAGFEVHYLNTDASGIRYYDIISANDGDGPQVMRVLAPTHPAAGVAHNFLYVLPVEPGTGSSFGDGLATLQAADAEDQYNVTIIEPTFYIDPWYANNPNDPRLQYETFMTTELQPWVTANLAASGTEQDWLIGFSKSGYGAQDLILKHPDLFTLAASWDFPADMSSYNQLGSDPAANYGTDQNFQSNYRLLQPITTPPSPQPFLDTYDGPFLGSDRIWTGGFSLYGQDVTDYDNVLTSQGIHYTQGPSQGIAHRWDSGWVPGAMSALYQMSLSQP